MSDHLLVHTEAMGVLQGESVWSGRRSHQCTGREGQRSDTHLHCDREGVSGWAHLLIQRKDPVAN